MGSSSNARKALLEYLGIFPYVIKVPKVCELQIEKEEPRLYVKRMAIKKSLSIVVKENDWLLTADTIVVVGKKILHKTSKLDVARGHLKLLSGRRHYVMTAYCLRHNKKKVLGLVKTILKMKKLDQPEIDRYLETREWVGKAGSYSIQGSALSYFPLISGCFSNVIGLPLPDLSNKLRGNGITIK